MNPKVISLAMVASLLPLEIKASNIDQDGVGGVIGGSGTFTEATLPENLLNNPPTIAEEIELQAYEILGIDGNTSVVYFPKGTAPLTVLDGGKILGFQPLNSGAPIQRILFGESFQQSVNDGVQKVTEEVKNIAVSLRASLCEMDTPPNEMSFELTVKIPGFAEVKANTKFVTDDVCE
ncbi:MAG: hypothetical protein ACRBBQ_09305 [Cognatishimia sp.]